MVWYSQRQIMFRASPSLERFYLHWVGLPHVLLELGSQDKTELLPLGALKFKQAHEQGFTIMRAGEKRTTFGVTAN